MKQKKAAPAIDAGAAFFIGASFLLSYTSPNEIPLSARSGPIRIHNYWNEAMGYDLHITRKDHWADDEGPNISLDEWTEYARRNSNLSLDPDNLGPENWIVAEHGREWPLWWEKTGEIVVKNPDPPMIETLVAIANALGARVLGDDDEVYGEGSKVG